MPVTIATYIDSRLPPVIQKL